MTPCFILCLIFAIWFIGIWVTYSVLLLTYPHINRLCDTEVRLLSVLWPVTVVFIVVKYFFDTIFNNIRALINKIKK